MVWILKIEINKLYVTYNRRGNRIYLFSYVVEDKR